MVSLVENLRKSLPPSLGVLQRIMALEQVAAELTDRCAGARTKRGTCARLQLPVGQSDTAVADATSVDSIVWQSSTVLVFGHPGCFLAV